MKRDARARAMALSATAVMAAFTTFFTTGCSNKDKGSKKEEENITIINDSNVAEVLAEKDKTGSRSNFDLFRWKPDKDAVDKITGDAEETDAVIFDAFKIYKNKDGKYFVIDKGEAYELLETVDRYQIVKEEDKSYVLTSLAGERLMVFGGEEALNEFTAMLKEKFEAAKADKKVLAIVNGIYVGDPVASKEVSRFDGTRTYYDFEAIMNTCIKGIEEGGYADPISYEKSEDKKSWLVKRTAYVGNAGGNVGSKEITLELPIGKTGEVYYDTAINMFVGIVFEEDGKFWICQDALYNVLGIDAVEGQYTVPGTTEKYDALIIDTAGGVDEPEVVVDKPIKKEEIEKPKVEIIIDPTMGQEDNPVVEQPSGNTPTYNQDIKDKLGIEVVLTGSNAEQAQQYYEACKAAYPNLPWYCGDNSAGIDVSSLRSETSVDVWSLTADELDALINERLAGRDYHDLSLEELYTLQDLTEGLSPLADEIGAYFNDLTSRDFVTGGYVVAE